MTVHNRRDTTLECISRFFKCGSLENFEVEFFLMDDGCTDGTSEAVLEAFPQVNILNGDGNLFWNRGMYYCWKEAIKKHHDFYFWLNDDTMLYENAIECLFNDYFNNGEMSIISGCCCDTGTNHQVTYGGRRDGKLVAPTGEAQEIEDMNGNAVLIPDCVCERIGVIDPYFQHSSGDTEYGYRAQKNGVKTLVSSAFIGTCNRHDHINRSSDARYSLIERLKYLNTPWGSRPLESFYLFSKYKNIWYATYLFLMSYIRCFFPIRAKEQ